MPSQDKQIKVSVLLAARNEESNIERCLQSLNTLDFPADILEICIGDDDSDDDTAAIIQRYIHNKPQFIYQKITGNSAGLRGKANVLAQLARTARGEYFCFCDADIEVPPTWISSMLKHFRGNTGIVVGLTRMKKNHILADFLSLEWLFILSVMRFLSLFKMPVTGMGNNMAVTRDAYNAVGGYENIGFSIVEDYALFSAIVKKGYGFKQTYESTIVATSEPIITFSDLVIQRRRWMKGVMQSPVILQICIIICALFIPLMLLLSIWDPQRSVDMVTTHYLFITGCSLLSVLLLKQWDLLKTVLFFWFYLLGVCLLMLVIYLSPGKTVWKGREY
jgi:cellulose synthase/poly-beta-1,6-N-acetylglucosamine synthase-like glycosyltransferase